MNANHKSRAVVIAGLIALIVAAVAFVRVSRTAGDSDQRERDTRADDSVPKAMAGFAKPMPIGSMSSSGSATRESKPWWSTLSKAEIEARHDDFEFMRGEPGAWPEFVEIHRQMLDAGVPRDIYEMECREVFGALLDLSQYERLEGEIMLPVRMNPDHPHKGEREAAAKVYAENRRAAEAEVRARLESVGFAPDSDAVARIFQLRPMNPLRRLATDPPPSTTPEYAPNPAAAMEERFAKIRARIDAAEHP